MPEALSRVQFPERRTGLLFVSSVRYFVNKLRRRFESLNYFIQSTVTASALLLPPALQWPPIRLFPHPWAWKDNR